MSVNKYNSATGKLERIAGGTLYADAPIGAIMSYGGATAPSGWLLCQGQAISRVTYADLFDAIGTTFGSGDGSTTFNLPDLREATTKGVGLSGKSSNHYDADGVALGEFVEDRIQSHTHTMDDTWQVNVSPSGTPVVQTGLSGYAFSGDSYNTSTPKSTRTGVTTEVKAVGVNYIIKAKQVAVPFDVAEYIRNQNILSEWEEPIFDGASFTAQYDGILNVWLSSDVTVNATLYINSVQIARLYPNAGVDSGAQLPIKKGDILTFSLSSGGIANMYKKVAYYKLRDYTGR